MYLHYCTNLKPPFLNIHSGRAKIVLARPPNDRICDTYFWMIKIPGRNIILAVRNNSNIYKIIIFGQFVTEIWTSEVAARKVHILINSNQCK